MKNKGNAPYPDIIIEHRYNHYKKKTETIFPGVIIEKIYVAIPSIPPPSYNNVLRENNIKAAIKNNSVVKPMKETYKQQMSRLKNEWNREVQARRASKRNSNKKDTNEKVEVGEEIPRPLIVSADDPPYEEQMPRPLVASADNPPYEEQMPVYRNLGVEEEFNPDSFAPNENSEWYMP